MGPLGLVGPPADDQQIDRQHDGEPGAFQTRHAVYGQTGKPCPRCGTPIEKIVLAQRGTHFCPHCQPLRTEDPA